MRGYWTGTRPARTWWMVKPAPQAKTRATASPGPGVGSGTVSSTKGWFFPFNNIAFIVIPPASILTQPPTTLDGGASSPYIVL
jgi:hypothetical protein